MGAYRKFYFRKKPLESLFIHAVYISSCVYSNHYIVPVESSGVYVNWEFKVLALWSLDGSNMVDYLQHIYHWWIGLPDSILINVSVMFILGWYLD